ncbi:hypothetical protein MXB_946 [Myxobolus squamalis]|nr:hypothetical protein MXB_946 [Myxobolus squamalis]
MEQNLDVLPKSLQECIERLICNEKESELSPEELFSHCLCSITLIKNIPSLKSALQLNIWFIFKEYIGNCVIRNYAKCHENITTMEAYRIIPLSYIDYVVSQIKSMIETNPEFWGTSNFLDDDWAIFFNDCAAITELAGIIKYILNGKMHERDFNEAVNIILSNVISTYPFSTDLYISCIHFSPFSNLSLVTLPFLLHLASYLNYYFDFSVPEIIKILTPSNIQILISQSKIRDSVFQTTMMPKLASVILGFPSRDIFLLRFILNNVNSNSKIATFSLSILPLIADQAKEMLILRYYESSKIPLQMLSFNVLQRLQCCVEEMLSLIIQFRTSPASITLFSLLVSVGLYCGASQMFFEIFDSDVFKKFTTIKRSYNCFVVFLSLLSVSINEESVALSLQLLNFIPKFLKHILVSTPSIRFANYLLSTTKSAKQVKSLLDEFLISTKNRRPSNSISKYQKASTSLLIQNMLVIIFSDNSQINSLLLSGQSSELDFLCAIFIKTISSSHTGSLLNWPNEDSLLSNLRKLYNSIYHNFFFIYVLDIITNCIPLCSLFVVILSSLLGVTLLNWNSVKNSKPSLKMYTDTHVVLNIMIKSTWLHVRFSSLSEFIKIIEPQYVYYIFSCMWEIYSIKFAHYDPTSTFIASEFIPNEFEFEPLSTLLTSIIMKDIKRLALYYTNFLSQC